MTSSTPQSEGLLSLLAGNETARAMLTKAAKGKPFHAYLITGPAGSGKKLVAKLLSAGLVCQNETARPCGVCSACRKVLKDGHPDVITVYREGKKHFLLEQARQIRQDAFIRPNEADYKIYILPDAAYMDTAAQNALLKLLEEPPSFTVIALLCERADQMLETVRSRCVEIPMAPLTEAELFTLLSKKCPEEPEARLKAAISASGGYAGRALAQLGEPPETEKTAYAIGEAIAKADEYEIYCAIIKTERYTNEDISQTLELVASYLRDAVMLKSGGEGFVFPPYKELAQKLAARFSVPRLMALYDAAMYAYEQSKLFMPGGNLPAAAAAAFYTACRRTL
jgi:DNA polymerase-3 subunit delta'